RRVKAFGGRKTRFSCRTDWILLEAGWSAIIVTVKRGYFRRAGGLVNRGNECALVARRQFKLNQSMRNAVIVALDVPEPEAAWKLVQDLAPIVGGFKIGSELFTAAGPDFVRHLRAVGAPVFLDLKFHDIPNTVAKAV